MEEDGGAREDEVTELRALVAELRRKLDFAQGAVDALPFPMFWKDRDSVYVGANREQAARASLAATSAIAGLSDDELPWTRAETEAFRADDRKVMTTGEPLSPIVETQQVLGKERLCETHKSPIRDVEGQVIGVVGWYEDVTERDQQRRAQASLEERILRAHKQDSLGTLVGGIAHDFNNILASIVANLWLVQEALPDEHPATECLADIQRAGLRAKRLVEQLTAIRPKQPEQLGPVSLQTVVLEASRLLRAMIPAGIEFEIQLSDDTPLVLGDGAQMHQVVINLCTNAWLALKDRPSVKPLIEVRLAPRTLDADTTARMSGRLAPGRFAVLSVRDTGVGMDAATQRRIFEPFFTTREVGAGTGLGLSVVHGIVTAHHGAIEVDSVPGKGTTMCVYLPQGPEQEPTPPPLSVRRSSRPPAALRHVLHVDDDEGILRVVTRLLAREGCHVTSFSDPREAEAELRRNPDFYDLLVVDFTMPHLSGLDLTRIAAKVTPELPVMLVSGYVSADLRRDAALLGVVRIVNKIDVATELRQAVRGLFAPPPTP